MPLDTLRMNGMNLLFAGLVALGVAIIIVVFLKCLCFVGEFLNDKRRNQQASSQSPTMTGVETGDGLLEPSLTSALLLQSERNTTEIVAAATTSTETNSTQRQGYSVRRLSDRIYVICVDPNSGLAVDPKFNLTGILDGREDLPPTYEEAVRLIAPNEHPNTNRTPT